MPRRLPFPFGRLVRMGRAWLVRILARLACALGWFHRVSVVPVLGCALYVGLLLIDHERDLDSFPPSRKRWQATDETRTAKVHARIDVETETGGVEERLAHRLGRLTGDLRYGSMPVDELLAAEGVQEGAGALGSGRGVDERA